MSCIPHKLLPFHRYLQPHNLAVTSISTTSDVVSDFTTTGTVYPATYIAQGDGVGDRRGRQILVRSIRLRGQVVPVNITESCHYNVCRVCVVWDLQPVPTVLPTVTDIFAVGSSLSPFNVLYQQRFIVLADVTKNCSGIYQVGNQLGHNVHFVEINIDDLSFVTTYSGVDGGMVNTGAMYVVTIGSESTLANAHQFEYQYRVIWDE